MVTGLIYYQFVKLIMQSYWVVICYNNDDDYNAKSIGIYSTSQKARAAVTTLIKNEFDELDDDEDERDEITEGWINEDGSKAETWEDFKKIITKRLRGSGVCSGLSYLNYVIEKQTVDA